VLQTNYIYAQCDKLATELSWQRFASKVVNVSYPTCIWRLRWGSPRLNFAKIFGFRKLESLGYRAALLRDTTLSRFSRTSTCDRRTDGQTDIRRQLIPALASEARVKINCVHSASTSKMWNNGEKAEATRTGDSTFETDALLRRDIEVIVPDGAVWTPEGAH